MSTHNICFYGERWKIVPKLSSITFLIWFTAVYHTLGSKRVRLTNCHTWHKLLTEICEIRQFFKGDLIKFCEIFTKITLELPQNSQKPLFKCKKLVKNTAKCDLCLFLHKMCCKMV